MKSLLPKLFIMFFFCAGCTLLPSVLPFIPGGGHQQLQSTTTVQLSENNYRLVKTNVVGSDWGISLLGLFSITSPDAVKAMKQLYEAGDVAAGKPLAIVNVLQQNTAQFYILFSIPTVTFRADVVEFMQATHMPPP